MARYPARADGRKPRTVASNKYNKDAYDRIAVNIKKGQREKIQAYAAARGESVNGLINRLLALEVPGFDGIGTNND